MSTMTPEEIIEFYNFKTEENLKRIRENLKRFEDKNIHMFASLILDSENYEKTLDQSEAINTLILNSRKQFTFTNSVNGNKETIFEEGVAKLCREYTNTYIGGLLKYLNEDDTYYLVFVKPVRLNKPYKGK